MPSARYWRLVGCAPYGDGADLAISELGLYEGATRRDTGPTCTYAPTAGTLAALADGDTSSMVTFAAADITKANFGFYWDLGAAVNVDSLSLGSTLSRSNFIARATLEASLDGIYWRPVSIMRGVDYLGPNTLTTVTKFKIVIPDALLRFEGANGAKIVENVYGSIEPFTFGTNVALSTVQKYAGVSSMSFPGGQTLHTTTFSAGTAFTGRFASRRFTFSAWIYPAAFDGFIAGSYGSTGTNQNEGWFCRITAGGGLQGSVSVSGTPTVNFNSAEGVLSLNTWQHVAMEREDSVGRLYLNGQLVAEVSSLPTAAIGTSVSRGLGIGCLNSNVNNTPFTGFIDDLVLVDNIALYGGIPFVAEAWVDQTGDNPSAYSLEPKAVLYDATADIKLFTPQNVNTTLRDTLPSESRIDMIFGGRGVIAGTVKEKSLPENTPLFRKVRLIDERSGYVVAETWSDAATGNYSFANIDRSRTYTVLSYDHTGLYRAVIADRLTPELMS